MRTLPLALVALAAVQSVACFLDDTDRPRTCPGDIEPFSQARLTATIREHYAEPPRVDGVLAGRTLELGCVEVRDGDAIGTKQVRFFDVVPDHSGGRGTDSDHEIVIAYGQDAPQPSPIGCDPSLGEAVVSFRYFADVDHQNVLSTCPGSSAAPAVTQSPVTIDAAAGAITAGPLDVYGRERSAAGTAEDRVEHVIFDRLEADIIDPAVAASL
ncbi:MAG: hypothetical protein D6689_00295 [Deltaproteobacteria bacterium]|nr:MAG: hypothetical protein D6689_00295 [Deltaproteobacteria bacterium]